MSGLPRWVDAALAVGGLLAALPVLVVAALLVRATSPGPALFRQTRLGQQGSPFTLWKLRSMRESGAGSAVTASGDARITPIGRLLRRTKLDELPQLWNVVRGDLALVGPRPEVPQHVDSSDPLWLRVLAVRPGLTDPVTLRLRGEEALLAQLRDAAGGDADTAYSRHLQPWKLRAYVAYLEQRTAASDVRCLLATVLSPLGWGFGLQLDPPTVDEVMRASGVGRRDAGGASGRGGRRRGAGERGS